MPPISLAALKTDRYRTFIGMDAMHFAEMGRFLLMAGGVLVLVGVVFLFADKLPLGRLPGDFTLGGGGFKFYVPVATCIILSILVTLVINFLSGK